MIPQGPYEEEILAIISKSMTDRGYPPSRRELAVALGIGVGTVQYEFKRMVARGVIEVEPRSARGIRAVKMIADTEPMS